MAEELTKKIEAAQKLQSTTSQHNQDAIKLYQEVIQHPLHSPDDITDEAVKAKETAVYKLAQIYKD